jgi:hypothetical protein
MKHANLKNLRLPAAVLTFATIALTSATAQTAKPKMATDIPPEITTPDTVETRIGTLKFFDGLPDKDTVEKCYDNLDFQRGVEVFLNTMPGASLYAMREELHSVGVDNQTVTLFETLMDSKSLFLTPNTDDIQCLRASVLDAARCRAVFRVNTRPGPQLYPKLTTDPMEPKTTWNP